MWPFYFALVLVVAAIFLKMIRNGGAAGVAGLQGQVRQKMAKMPSIVGDKKVAATIGGVALVLTLLLVSIATDQFPWFVAGAFLFGGIILIFRDKGGVGAVLISIGLLMIFLNPQKFMGAGSHFGDQMIELAQPEVPEEEKVTGPIFFRNGEVEIWRSFETSTRRVSVPSGHCVNVGAPATVIKVESHVTYADLTPLRPASIRLKLKDPSMCRS